ncbi:HAD domain-containing protein [Noviherbaspirillum sp.]|uniref:HAD domain-containing protein n=1 Tax=Noviherbaspirillum sp. TaxID=1926288 RepID=UPI002FE37217
MADIGRDKTALLFVDIDDVICLNQPYGGYHVSQPAARRPTDLWEKLWHGPSTDALKEIMSEHHPKIVITSSWLKFMGRDGFEALFHVTGLSGVANALHDAWEAPQNRGQTRCETIEKWMASHYQNEQFVVLDDALSGTGLAGSKLDSVGRVILCEVGKGLGKKHVELVRRVLAQR